MQYQSFIGNKKTKRKDILKELSQICKSYGNINKQVDENLAKNCINPNQISKTEIIHTSSKINKCIYIKT